MNVLVDAIIGVWTQLVWLKYVESEGDGINHKIHSLEYIS